MFDVSTDAATLNDNSGMDVGIFADLGSGTSYGTFLVPSYTTSFTETISFDLNSAALADITDAAGGFFSIGGALLSGSIGDHQLLFHPSDGAGIQRFTIETEPLSVHEPASLALLGMGLVTFGGRAWRRRRAAR